MDKKKVLPAGPTYKSMKIKGNTIVLKFDHVGKGFTTWNRETNPHRSFKGHIDPPPITGFSIAGADGKFVWADAQVKGKKIIVSSDQIEHPVAVRYGWANNPECNLYNMQGIIGAAYLVPHLPMSPFRTDDFPMITRNAE